MADVRGMVHNVFHPTATGGNKKDKLEQTKLREREIKEAYKNEIAAEKAKNAEKKHDILQQCKEERVLHDTKRAAKDKREAAKKEAHAETGQECEHGVWRCKICFPHKDA